jgi:hypothetical protein
MHQRRLPAKERVTRVTVLGVHGSGSTLWLCLVEDERALETDPGRLELREGLEAGYAIGSFRDECTRTLKALAPDRIAILDMEQSRQVPKIADMRARFTAEALLAACAIDAGLPCVRLPRATVRSRLGLPRSGKLADHVSLVFDAPTGTYWKAKRDFAALAARAEIVEG